MVPGKQSMRVFGSVLVSLFYTESVSGSEESGESHSHCDSDDPNGASQSSSASSVVYEAQFFSPPGTKVFKLNLIFALLCLSHQIAS